MPPSSSRDNRCGKAGRGKAEVRAIERERDYLVYACNLSPETVEFTLEGSGGLGAIQDLRSLHRLESAQVKLMPYQETIFKIEKANGK